MEQQFENLYSDQIKDNFFCVSTGSELCVIGCLFHVYMYSNCKNFKHASLLLFQYIYAHKNTPENFLLKKIR